MNFTNILKRIAISSMAVSSFINASYLKIEDRPEEVKAAITRTFDVISDDTSSTWGSYNGVSCYSLIGDDHLVAQKIIQGAPKDQTEFFFLDIGAGDFEWGRALVKFLNSKDFGRKFTAHIMGVRGERLFLFDSQEGRNGSCILYERGNFQIENIGSILKNDCNGKFSKFDLIVSRWTFRHLVDPVGTFVQTYDLLRPGTGMFFGDGFFFQDKAKPEEGKEDLMLTLLHQTQAPFLKRSFDLGRSLHPFVIQRKDSESLKLPMSYQRLVMLQDERQCNANSKIEFSIKPDNTDFKYRWNNNILYTPEALAQIPLLSGNDVSLLGHESLAQWFKGIFTIPNNWKPYVDNRSQEKECNPTAMAVPEDKS